MRVGIYYIAEKVRDEAIVTALCEKISLRGSEAVVFRSAEEIGGVDRLIVLGGDGTILRAAGRTSELGIPLVGVNYGTLGFLTEFEREDAPLSVDLALDGACPIVSHSMLEIELNGQKTHCLNELMLQRGVSARREIRIATIAVRIDGSFAGNFRADGLIVSTPTGSTAYSLSAGGSIMAPDCRTFMLTPVCAFSLKSRPIAYSDQSTLSFEFSEGQDGMMAYGDGKFLGEVRANDRLIVRKSSRSAQFLTRDRNGFFRRLTEKISY
ncbi:MAG: NAD(+)/NADH kinase [Candidatus Gallimonas sp.]